MLYISARTVTHRRFCGGGDVVFFGLLWAFVHLRDGFAFCSVVNTSTFGSVLVFTSTPKFQFGLSDLYTHLLARICRGIDADVRIDDRPTD